MIFSFLPVDWIWLLFCLFLHEAPGTYSPEKYSSDHQPSYSFGSKHEQKLKSDIPGNGKMHLAWLNPLRFEEPYKSAILNSYLAPGAYSPEKYNLDHQPAYSFGSRQEQKVKSISPGK